MHPTRHLLALLLAAALPALTRADAPAPPSDLTDYVRKEDQSFAWKPADKVVSDAGTVYNIDLVSQTWHDIKWEHKLQLFVAKDAKPTATVVLWNQGGTPSATSALLGLELAKKIGAPVAFLYGIPNQPLFGGKREDALIAETFVKYLETKDSSWPLLFPMVKSLLRAMDAIQAFAKEQWQADVKDFVVTGASKRGWTAWLTAATGDQRVKAIAPMVIDTLNMPVQMKNQLAAFGKPSEMIHDYVDRKLVPVPDTPEVQKLWKMIDPWVYREQITVPKMLINGANDPYWPLDALNTYWDDLKGEKYVLYVPNAGHDLREVGKDGKKETLPARALNTLAAFCKCQVFDKPMPKLTWTNGAGRPLAGFMFSGAESDGKQKAIRRWYAESDTRDFRKARWEGMTFEGDVSKYQAVRRPGSVRFEAYLLEFEYEQDGLTFSLSTQIQILEPKK